jgi:hypothetical protein
MLRARYERSTRAFTHSFTGQQRANECSLKIAWILGQHKKTFSDATVVKECLNAAAETLLEGKQRDELWKKKANPNVRCNDNQKIRNVIRWRTVTAWCGCSECPMHILSHWWVFRCNGQFTYASLNIKKPSEEEGGKKINNNHMCYFTLLKVSYLEIENKFLWNYKEICRVDCIWQK